MVGSADVADYQWSALLMAILWRGMDDRETAALTDAMMRSGEVVDLAAIPGRKVDKHSTGGVGDKTSLILAPIAAACGVPVPMVSGRGLGHTGGTLDKLESISGLSRRPGPRSGYQGGARDECGLVLIGQTAEIAPADKRLYALRDATATVEAIPLIWRRRSCRRSWPRGSTAWSSTSRRAMAPSSLGSRTARALAGTDVRHRSAGWANEMVALHDPDGSTAGTRAVGNAVEVAESVACLRGEGPEDLTDPVDRTGRRDGADGREGRDSIDAARASSAAAAIADGSALERFRRVVDRAGGRPSRRRRSPICCPQRAGVSSSTIPSPSSGVIHALGARSIGDGDDVAWARGGRGRIRRSTRPSA